MFEKLGMFANLMTQLPKIQAEMGKLQQRLGELSAEGQAGGGVVKVRVNGHRLVTKVTLADEALQDRELLEEYLAAAASQAVEKVQTLVQEEAAKMAGTLGLPPGMGLPGLPGLN